jgi:EAL domain-containing protein (putative c-di-GMP-specific phosphodiesterase class I)
MNMMGELCSVLKELNTMLAFDDFGVGKARLLELGEVRPDFLKFDMELTNNIEHASIRRQELVALFATLVNNLGIQTLAEGVETREYHDILVQMGFQLGQGYYYGRPSPISKSSEKLKILSVNMRTPNLVQITSEEINGVYVSHIR